MPSDILQEAVSAIADATGTAVGRIGPFRGFERWYIRGLTTQSDSTDEVELRVYRGGVSDSNLVASSYSGKLDTAGGSAIRLSPGEELVAQWTGATVGAKCTLRVEGERLT